MMKMIQDSITDIKKFLAPHEVKIDILADKKLLSITSAEIPCRSIFNFAAFKGKTSKEIAEYCEDAFLTRINVRMEELIRNLGDYRMPVGQILSACERMDAFYYENELHFPDYSAFGKSLERMLLPDAEAEQEEVRDEL